MNPRSIAIFFGLGLLGCASKPAVVPTPPVEQKTPVSTTATAEPAPAEPVAVPAAVEVPVAEPAAEPAATPAPPVEVAKAEPSPPAASAGKKKKPTAKPAVPAAAKPATASADAPPAPPAPPAPVVAPTKPAAVSVPAYSGPDACTLATKGDSSVAAACAKGGVKEARKEMKRMLKKAKDAGHKTECDDCHPDDDFGKLTKDGRDKFKELARFAAM